MGQFQDAETKFLEAQERQRRWPQEPTVLYSYQGFQHRELLLDLKEYQKVIDETLQTEKLTAKFQKMLGTALDQLQLGRACLLQAQIEGSNDINQATQHLETGVEMLRQAGIRDELPRGLLARAELYRLSRLFQAAERDLDEVIAITKPLGMVLYQADCYLEYAKLYLSVGDELKAKVSLNTAKEIITHVGYHRRDAEIANLEAALSNNQLNEN